MVRKFDKQIAQYEFLRHGISSVQGRKTLQNATWRMLGEYSASILASRILWMLFIGDFYRKLIWFSMVDVKVVVTRLVLCLIRPEQPDFRSSLVSVALPIYFQQDVVRALAVHFLSSYGYTWTTLVKLDFLSACTSSTSHASVVLSHESF